MVTPSGGIVKLLALASVATAVMLLGAGSAMAQSGANNGARPANAPVYSPPSNATSAAGSLSASSTKAGTTPNGLGTLVGPGAQNGGAISAHFSSASVDGEQRVVVDLYGDRLVSIAASKAEENKFQAGTQVLLSPGQASRIVDTAVNMSGIVQAKSAFVDGNGEVVLDGAIGGSITGETKTVAAKKPTGLPKQDAQIAGITTLSNPTTLQVKTKTVDLPPSPSFDSLLKNIEWNGSPRTWGDVLAFGAAFSANGVLFSGYFYNLFDTVVTLASARSDGTPAIDYAACYLGSKGAIDDCAIKPGAL